MHLESHKLAGALRDGFRLGHQTWLWGTTLKSVATSANANPRRHNASGWIDTDEASDLAGLSLPRGSVFGPSMSRPVLQASYVLGVDVEHDSALDRLVESISFGIGDARIDHFPLVPYGTPSGQVRASATWRVGAVHVSLSAWHGVREERGVRSTGGLYIRHDEAPLAQPFIAEYEASAAPWRQLPTSNAVTNRVLVPGLRPFGVANQTLTAVEYAALFRPYLRAAPAWTFGEAFRREICLWVHPAGYCGIAGEGHTWVDAGTFEGRRFELVRVRPAKGSGNATLYVGEGDVVASSAPGEAGLDAVSQELREMGAVVTVTEEADC